MKRKIIIRKIVSKPPTQEQRIHLYNEMYRIMLISNSSTQSKVVEKNSEHIYVLRENKDLISVETD